MEPVDRFILITNLSTVTIGPVRTFTHALLLEETEGLFRDSARRYRARGFGTEGSAPIFDMDVPSLDYTIGPVQGGGPIFIGVTDSRPRHLFHVAKLDLGDVTLILGVEDPSRTLDIQEWSGTPDTRVILEVWKALPEKVAMYWSAPAMPVQAFLPVRQAREIALRNASW